MQYAKPQQILLYYYIIDLLWIFNMR